MNVESSMANAVSPWPEFVKVMASENRIYLSFNDQLPFETRISLNHIDKFSAKEVHTQNLIQRVREGRVLADRLEKFTYHPPSNGHQ